ncbi:MAG: acyl carrier protein [Proteobacteria bacterium]|nr:acyl carrier protein [Desulfobulbaceae bacterium]MBU4153229.1 acyl carrier protein [Pseudomonadota bacterium]
MPTKEALRNFLKELLVEYGETSEFTDDASLLISGILDSLAVLRIVVFLEQEFGLDLSDQGFDQNDFDSVASIMRMIEERCS